MYANTLATNIIYVQTVVRSLIIQISILLGTFSGDTQHVHMHTLTHTHTRAQFGHCIC